MSDFLSIRGGMALQGQVRVAGAKNSALPLLFATLLTPEKCRLSNVPDLEDIAVTQRLLRSVGAHVEYTNHNLIIQTPEVKSCEAPYGLVKALRASFWALGPLVARCREARVALPGGDAIGTRPVDLHLKGLARLGADVRMSHGVVIASAPGGLRGRKIVLDYPSVGATHHLMMTAALVSGETILKGAAREPEVVDLAKFLSAMGAAVEGAGTTTIRIKGRKDLGGASHEVLGDRIEAATFILAGVVTNGKVNVSGISPVCLESVLDLLEQAGCSVATTEFSVEVTPPERLHPVSFQTAPFPGIATDVQPMLMAALTRAKGTSRVTETVFENRFGHVAEYRRFGAQIAVAGRIAAVTGVEQLSGAPVEAVDIRAAAGLVLMGLMADGQTDIADVFHLDRGYESFTDKLSALGAEVKRVPAFEKKEVVCGC